MKWGFTMKSLYSFEKSNILKQKSHKLIPGGAHTYSKGDDQFPVEAPAFVERGQGAHVWDVDGNEFIDYGMGLRSVTLGYGYAPVNEAAYAQMLKGNNFTRPSYLETETAEKLVSLIKGMEMCKFGKNGSTVTTAAVKLARAYTGRDMVARCAEHSFFSYDDWFIGSTDMNNGVPEAIKNLTVQFNYNNIESLKTLFDKHPNQIACVILEPATHIEPKDNFLQKVKDECRKNGAVFILDEMITGFRWHLNGAQAYYGVEPDLCTFGKGIANGFSVAALLGKREIMNLGSIYGEHERVFLISTTHGAENLSLAACMKTLEIYEKGKVVDHVWRQGTSIVSGINKAAEAAGLTGFIEVAGLPCSPIILCRDKDKQISMEFRTLFLQETIKRGILAPYIALSYSHTDEDIKNTVDAIQDSMKVYKAALENGVENYLIGRAVKPVFRKYN